MQIDVRVLELLSSKLCHDLISPVSAINNGVELIEDIGDAVEEEAMKLIGDSAANAARRLRLFRAAYGRAGSEESLPLRDMRVVAEQYFVQKIKLNWPQDLELPGVEAHQGALKVLLNVLIMSEEILAYGGAITLRRLTSDDTIGCVIEVAGRNAVLSVPFRQALENQVEVENLTPRTIQPYITGRFADYFGLSISGASPTENQLVLTLQVVAPAYDALRGV